MELLSISKLIFRISKDNKNCEKIVIKNEPLVPINLPNNPLIIQEMTGKHNIVNIEFDIIINNK